MTWMSVLHIGIMGGIPHGMNVADCIDEFGDRKIVALLIYCTLFLWFFFYLWSFIIQIIQPAKTDNKHTHTHKLSPQTKSDRSWGCETMTNPMHVYTVMRQATILGDGPSVQWEWSPDAHHRWWWYEPTLHQRDFSEIVRFTRVANLRDRLWYYGTRNWEIDEHSSTGSANDPCTTSHGHGHGTWRSRSKSSPLPWKIE